MKQNKRRTILPFAILILSTIQIFSQGEDGNKALTEPEKNAVYLEFLGNNGTYSINYERVLLTLSKHHDRYAFSAGFNIPFSIFETKISLELKYIRGQVHALELGSGLTLGTSNWFDESEPDKFAGSYFVFRAGYRYSKNGLIIRLAPMVHLPKYWSSAVWGGVSIGYFF